MPLTTQQRIENSIPITQADAGKLYTLSRRVNWPIAGDDRWPTVGHHVLQAFPSDEKAIEHFNQARVLRTAAFANRRLLKTDAFVMLLACLYLPKTSDIYKLFHDGQIYYGARRSLEPFMHEKTVEEHNGD